MRTMPEWILGGDPIRLSFQGDGKQFHPDNLVWTRVASWGTGEISLAAEVGRSRQGAARAYRIVGDVTGTARSLRGDIGWLTQDVATNDIEVPSIDPYLWSSEWRQFCHGKIDETELIRRLCPMNASCWISFPVGAPPRHNALTRSVILLAAGMALGIAMAFLFSEDSEITEPIAHPPPRQSDGIASPAQRAEEPTPPEAGNQPPNGPTTSPDVSPSPVPPDEPVGEQPKPLTPTSDAVDPGTSPNK